MAPLFELISKCIASVSLISFVFFFSFWLSFSYYLLINNKIGIIPISFGVILMFEVYMYLCLKYVQRKFFPSSLGNVTSQCKDFSKSDNFKRQLIWQPLVSSFTMWVNVCMTKKKQPQDLHIVMWILLCIFRCQDSAIGLKWNSITNDRSIYIYELMDDYRRGILGYGCEDRRHSQHLKVVPDSLVFLKLVSVDDGSSAKKAF